MLASCTGEPRPRVPCARDCTGMLASVFGQARPGLVGVDLAVRVEEGQLAGDVIGVLHKCAHIAIGRVVLVSQVDGHLRWGESAPRYITSQGILCN